MAITTICVVLFAVNLIDVLVEINANSDSWIFGWRNGAYTSYQAVY